MQPFIAATIITFLGAATALPATLLEARAEGGATFCTGENYTGDCTHVANIPFNECQKVPADFVGKVGSFKPDPQSFCRITYTADTCTMHGDAFIWPDTGAPNLHQFSDPATGTIIDAGSKMTSYLCQQCTGCTS